MDWQLGIVSLVIALAAWHVVWRGYRLVRRDPGRRSCGGCNGCGGSKADSSHRHIVSLDLGRTPAAGTDANIQSKLI